MNKPTIFEMLGLPPAPTDTKATQRAESSAPPAARGSLKALAAAAAAAKTPLSHIAAEQTKEGAIKVTPLATLAYKTRQPGWPKAEPDTTPGQT